MPFIKFRPQRQFGRYNTRIFKNVLKARNKRLMPLYKAPPKKFGIMVHDPLDPGFFKLFEEAAPAPPAPTPMQMYALKRAKESHPLYKQQQCFLFDGTNSLTDGVDQACALIRATKWQPLPPEALHKAIPADFLPANFEQLLGDCIMAGERFDPSMEKLPRKHDPVLFWIKHKPVWGTPVLKRNNIILENLCRKFALLSMRHKLQQFEDFRCDFDEPMSAFLSANQSGIGLPMVFRHQPHIVLQSPGVVSALGDGNSVRGTSHEEVPSVYPISPLIDLERSNIYNDVPVLPRQIHPQLNIHTILFAREQCQKYPWTMEENAANTICHCFGAAVAQAMRSPPGFEQDDWEEQILKRPIVAKAVQLVGGKLDFALVQLNTLNLANRRGIKNMVWLDKACPLYKPKPMHETMTAVEELNMETARKLIGFLLYK